MKDTEEFLQHSPISYGFKWGAATVERMCSDLRKGWVYIGVTTPKDNERIHVYVTKTGKTRVFKGGKEMKVQSE